MQITRTSAACDRETFAEYDVKVGETEYVVTHRPKQPAPATWSVHVRCVPKKGAYGLPYWRMIKGAWLVREVAEYERSLEDAALAETKRRYEMKTLD